MKKSCGAHLEKEKCQREQKKESKKTDLVQKKGSRKEMDLTGGEDPNRGSKAESRREKRRGSLLWQHPEIPSTITEGAVLEVIIIVVNIINMAIINMAIINMVIINIITQSSIQRSPEIQCRRLQKKRQVEKTWWPEA